MRRQMDQLRQDLAAALAQSESPRSGRRSRRGPRRDPSSPPSDSDGDEDDDRNRGRRRPHRRPSLRRSRSASQSRSRSRDRFRDRDVGYFEPDDSKPFLEIRDKLRVYHNVHSFIKAARLAEDNIKLSSMKRRFSQCLLGKAST